MPQCRWYVYGLFDFFLSCKWSCYSWPMLLLIYMECSWPFFWKSTKMLKPVDATSVFGSMALAKYFDSKFWCITFRFLLSVPLYFNNMHDMHNCNEVSGNDSSLLHLWKILTRYRLIFDSILRSEACHLLHILWRCACFTKVCWT